MKGFDMFYKLKVEEGHGFGRKTYYKYGVTNQHAENRASRVEKSARKNGHDMKVKAEKFYFNPKRSSDISRIEMAIHSDSSLSHYDDHGHSFNGSTEIYTKHSARKIEKMLRDNGIDLIKCNG